MLYIGYFIIVSGHNMSGHKKLYCLQQVHLAENLPEATHPK